MVRLFLRAASHNPYLCDNGTTVKILDKWLIFFGFAVVRHRGKVLPGYMFKRKSEFTFYIDYTN